MCGDAASIEQTGGSTEERSRADHREPFGHPSDVSNHFHDAKLLARGVHATAPGNQHGVDWTHMSVIDDRGQRDRCEQRHAALGGHRPWFERAQQKFVARCCTGLQIENLIGPGKHLVRPDDIERLYSRVADEDDAAHEAIFDRTTDGVNDIYPTFHAKLCRLRWHSLRWTRIELP